MANKFWGQILGVVTNVLALPVIITSGVVSKIKGDTFDNGIKKGDTFCEPIINNVENFGDKHNDKINDAGIGIVTTTVAILLGSEIKDHNKPKS